MPGRNIQTRKRQTIPVQKDAAGDPPADPDPSCDHLPPVLALSQCFKEVLDLLPDATVAIDLDGRVIAWNKAIEDMTGVPAENILGKGDYEYALPFYGERKPILINLVFKSKKEIEKDYKLIRRQKDVLIAETVCASLKGERVVMWGKACAIRARDGRIIGAIETIRNITELKKTEAELRTSKAQLQEQKVALEQKNVDLKDILSQVELEKKRIQDDVVSNVRNVLLPILQKVRLKGGAQKYVRLMEQGLEEITASFGKEIAQKKYHLTPREIEICHMIKNGMTGKDIARLLNLSFLTVEMHRKNIRRKLGVANKKVNLRTLLQDF
jgi:PAS domain S-box-containing protein